MVGAFSATAAGIGPAGAAAAAGAVAVKVAVAATIAVIVECISATPASRAHSGAERGLECGEEEGRRSGIYRRRGGVASTEHRTPPFPPSLARLEGATEKVTRLSSSGPTSQDP